MSASCCPAADAIDSDGTETIGQLKDVDTGEDDRIEAEKASDRLWPFRLWAFRTRHCRHGLKANRCAVDYGCLQSSFHGFFRSFWAAYAFKVSVSGVVALLSRRIFRWPMRTIMGVVGLDSLRFGICLGAFTSAFKMLLCLLRWLRNNDDWLNSFIAGSLAAYSLRFDVASRRSTWALYALTRAADLLVRFGVSRGMYPSMYHGDVLVFSAVSAVVMTAWHLEPEALPSSYHAWIRNKGGLDMRQLSITRDIALRGAPSPDEVLTWCRDSNIPLWKHGANPKLLPCSVMHPMEPNSCTLHTIKRWFHGFPMALPVYVTVHTVPLLLFRAKSLVRTTRATLQRLGIDIFRSTSFLTSFQSIYWFFFCHTTHFVGHQTAWATYIAGLMSGLSVLWERKSRRAELALFTLPRAIAALYDMAVRRGRARYMQHGELILFSASMGVVMAFFQHEPDIIKPTYLRLLRRIFQAC